jgi:hypothetical protein
MSTVARDDGCICKRITYDESYHELHESGCPATIPLLRGPWAHSVKLSLDDDYLSGEIICHATEGADCRMVCSEDCEAWDLVDHEHPMVDSGKCTVAEWINNADVIEAHVGSHKPVDGYIEAEFDGDGFIWRYVDV